MRSSPNEIARCCLTDLSSREAAIAYCDSIARSQTELSGDYAAAAAILRQQSHDTAQKQNQPPVE